MFVKYSFRWQSDPLCEGPFPQTFSEIKRTLECCRREKYGKAPSTAEEIRLEFQKQEIFEDLGKSRHREHDVFFNNIQIEPNFCNCLFSSSKSISLIREHIREQDRFYLMDGTFRITPRGIFQQVLIIHLQYRQKVGFYFALSRVLKIYLKNNESIFSTSSNLDLSHCVHFNVSSYNGGLCSSSTLC